MLSPHFLDGRALGREIGTGAIKLHAEVIVPEFVRTHVAELVDLELERLKEGMKIRLAQLL